MRRDAVLNKPPVERIGGALSSRSLLENKLMPGITLLQYVMWARNWYLWLRCSVDISKWNLTLWRFREGTAFFTSAQTLNSALWLSTRSQYNKEPQCRAKPGQGWHTSAKLISQHWGCHSSTGDTLRGTMCSVRGSLHDTAVSHGSSTGDRWSQVSFTWNVRSCLLGGFFSSCNSPVMSISVCFQQR